MLRQVSWIQLIWFVSPTEWHRMALYLACCRSSWPVPGKRYRMVSWQAANCSPLAWYHGWSLNGKALCGIWKPAIQASHEPKLPRIERNVQRWNLGLGAGNLEVQVSEQHKWPQNGQDWMTSTSKSMLSRFLQLLLLLPVLVRLWQLQEANTEEPQQISNQCSKNGEDPRPVCCTVFASTVEWSKPTSRILTSKVQQQSLRTKAMSLLRSFAQGVFPTSFALLRSGY